jgi:hypothetical protein
MARFDVAGLPAGSLSAAGAFHAEQLPAVLAAIAGLPGGEDLVLVFPPADHCHAGWRLAAVQDIARECAPVRVNAVASDSAPAIAAAQAYLARADGVTGQYWPLDESGAAAA